MTFLSEQQRAQIGLTYLMNMLELITPYGREKKKKLRAYKRGEVDKLIKELDNVEKVKDSLKHNTYIYIKIENLFFEVKDIKHTLKRCEDLFVLDEIEFFEIKSFAILCDRLSECFIKLNLDIPSLKINSLNEVVNILDPEHKKISSFYIYEDYSEKLRIIRDEKRRLEQQIISEKNEKNIEALKQRRLDIVIEEEQEEFIIRRKLTEALRVHLDSIRENMDSVGKLDMYMAKAKLADKYNGVKPKICTDIHIEFEDIINPQLFDILTKQNKSITPISVSLNQGTSVITGANMSGKSAAMKVILVNMILAHYGFFVFAAKAEIPVFDYIGYIAEDEQSLSSGLSSFGAEIVKLKNVMDKIKSERCFVALDELARGTNPKEGYCLVKAVAGYLRNFETVSVIATHYDGIVDKDMTHYQVIGLKYVDFDKIKYRIISEDKASIDILQECMDYRLELVQDNSTVPKDALNVCICLGLDKELIDRIKEYYDR
ncbi:MutS-related protein [Clostridium oryzae]|uniref:DNA mismatch repair protein MutS n=1 Tax=Clostridium oryzae TaxID=1450648 RepID=A0A1V4ICN4_9CLOT|nr:hypothetical protein [Clostridium oryzae]OPJ57762.1 DNA mismatch repair protein MutS [Clostridium oryzae]